MLGLVSGDAKTVAINPSGSNDDAEAWKLLLIAHLPKSPSTPTAPEPDSNPNKWPMSWVCCWTTIPPSPVVFEPEANKINLSAISRLVLCWNEAVPNTVKFLSTFKSCRMVTSSGNLIWSISPGSWKDAEISFWNPWIVSDPVGDTDPDVGAVPL